jgi:hypothetical protein
MRRGHLDDLLAFLAVAREKSFTMAPLRDAFKTTLIGRSRISVGSPGQSPYLYKWIRI